MFTTRVMVRVRVRFNVWLANGYDTYWNYFSLLLSLSLLLLLLLLSSRTGLSGAVTNRVSNSEGGG